MSMKLKLIFVFLTFALWSCQGEKEIIRESVPARNDGLPDLSDPNNGGSDTGGGNGLCREQQAQGKRCFPLESFRQEIEVRPEYPQFVKPIIEKLISKYRPLAADLMYLSRARKWYFVPVELKNLPARYIGTGFMTEQLALHKEQEIWISTLHYDIMKPNDQATLLVHELVMGVRLMEFQDDRDRCLARATENLTYENGQADYEHTKRKCYEDNLHNPANPREISLSDRDHANIRDLTDMLLNDLDELEPYEIEGWLKQKSFRQY